MKVLRRKLLLACSAAPWLSIPRLASAQSATSFPSKPIRLLFSSSPVGLLDIATRIVGDKMTIAWKQPNVVEAKPGANGLVAGIALASAPPDGQTLLVTNSGIVQATLVQQNSHFQLASLQPVFLLGM